MRFYIIAIVLFSLQSCSEPEGKVEKKQIEFEEILEQPKSSSLFHNQREKLYQIPRKDERRKDPKLDALLITVEKAIRKKDLNLLFSVMDEDVVSSYGGGVFGYDGLKETWERDFQKLWEKLTKILSLGGLFVNESNYGAPYNGNVHQEATKLDEMIVPYGYGISTSSNSKLYPNVKCSEDEGVIIGRAYLIIDLESNYYGGLNNIWKVNILGTGIHGFVRSEDFYCASDYSLGIQKNKQGIWKITSFAPWD